MRVLFEGKQSSWPLRIVTTEHEIGLSLQGRGNRVWSAVGEDLFEALLDLRRRLDLEGVRLCCNGSRLNSWPSSMQRQMARGRFVYQWSRRQALHPLALAYLLRLGIGRLRGQVGQPTLGRAPSAKTATVAEQVAFHEAWAEWATNLP